jgi:hypothetical protein
MEKLIEKHKHELLSTGTNVHWDPDNDHEASWETERGPIKEEDESLDDEDLAYINDILNSFSKPEFSSEYPRDPELQLFSPEGALTRTPALMKTPLKFNQNFNQNSMSYNSEEENFSYFSNFEEEGSTELADYFSDEEEDDNLDNEEHSSESDPWNQPDFGEFEDFPIKGHTPSKLDTTIFGLESISEADFKDQGENSDFNGISSLSEETLAFSAWQPFIPREHAFRNYVARSWPSDFSPQASSSQEPTLIRISTITTTKPTPAPTRPTLPRQQETPLSPLKDWHSYRPAMKPSTRNWMKPWPEFTEMYSRVKNSPSELPDHPERSKQYRLWKQQSTYSPRTTQNQNTRCQNMPQVTDAGREPQVCIQFQSRTSSNTKSEISTTGIRSWGTKWHKSSIRIPTYRTKLQKSTKRHQKSSRTPLWLWSRRRYPPICSLGTARMGKPSQKQKISPRGENHCSKRRSETESYNQQSERYNQYERTNSKSDIKSENKDVKVRNEEKLMTLLINAKAKVTAKADKVKAIEKTLKEFRVEKEKQLDKKIETESPGTLPPHFATTFNSSICTHITFTIFILTFNIFISIFNSFVSDPLDHHFQTFTMGDLSDCKVLCLSRQTTSVQAKTTVNAFANPDSI